MSETGHATVAAGGLATGAAAVCAGAGVSAEAGTPVGEQAMIVAKASQASRWTVERIVLRRWAPHGRRSGVINLIVLPLFCGKRQCL